MEILKEDLLQNSLDRHNPIPKKSTFGKNRMLLSMDLAKMEVDLKNSSDQEKETRKQREIQFIERAVRSLRFFQDKKQQLTDKLYLSLLEKLKYEFIAKEKPLFFHGDRGEKYYIVLKGELALLLPPKPYEEKKVIDPLAIQRLKEKYFRVRDGEQLMKVVSPNEHRPSTPSAPRLIKIVNERFKGPMARLRSMSSAAKRSSFNDNFSQSPSSISPNVGLQIQLQSNKTSGVSSPTKPMLLHMNSIDFDAEKEKEIQTSFDLYASAFFPLLNLAAIFREGSAFGEIALLRKTERSGTVISKEDSHLMTLDKDSFDEVLGAWERQKTDQQIMFLKSYLFFSEVNEKYLMGLLHSLEMKTLIRGEVFCYENDFPDYLYLLHEGEVELSTQCNVQNEQINEENLEDETRRRCYNNNNNQIATVRLSLLTPGSSICEDSIILEQSTIGYRAEVSSTQAELWIIDRNSFVQLIKQQRTFKKLIEQSQKNQDIRQRRLAKIIATISQEASTQLKVTRLESKRNIAESMNRTSIDYSKNSRFINQMIQESQNERENEIKEIEKMQATPKEMALKHKNIKITNQTVKQKPKTNHEEKSSEQLYFSTSKEYGGTKGKNLSNLELDVKQQQMAEEQLPRDHRSSLLNEEISQVSDRQGRKNSEEIELTSERKKSRQYLKKFSDKKIKNQTKKTELEGEISSNTMSSIIQSEDQYSHGEEQLLSIFSRTSDIERIQKTNIQKSNIFDRISKNSLATQQLQEQLEQEEEIQRQNNLNNQSNKPQPFLPFQKNFLFQPKLGNGLRREPFVDPFNPITNEGKISCQTTREKTTTNQSDNLLRSASFQKLSMINQTNNNEQISHFPSPRSNFSASINSVFTLLLKNQSVTEKNLTNFIEQTTGNESLKHKQEKLPQNKQHSLSKIKEVESSGGSNEMKKMAIARIFVKPQNISVPYLEDANNNLSQKSQQAQQKKHSILDHFQDPSPISKQFSTKMTFRSSESLPSLVKLKSHQEVNNIIGNNCQNKLELQPISERQQLLEQPTSIPKIENTYHLYTSRNPPHTSIPSSSISHLDRYQKRYSDCLSSRRVISTLNLNASESAFDHLRVLSTEEDSRDEDESTDIKQTVASTEKENKQQQSKFRQSSCQIYQKEHPQNIHMEKLRLTNSKSSASLKQLNRTKKQLMNKQTNNSSKVFYGDQENKTNNTWNEQNNLGFMDLSENIGRISPRKQNIAITQQVINEQNKPCVGYFFRPNQTFTKNLVQSSSQHRTKQMSQQLEPQSGKSSKRQQQQ